MSKSPGKFVDLAAMSMSGSLMPSIPVQILLKYNPPKLTIVYHFENKENDQYYHDIIFDKRMLQNESDEDIVSHLYMSEGYYFNPKILKRNQVKRLVSKLKSQMDNFHSSDKSPERHSIHSQGGSMGGSPSPLRGNHNQGNIKGNYQQQNFNQRQNLHLQTQNNQNNNPAFLGTNIDGIPLANRSPPRNQSQNEQSGIHLNGNLSNQKQSKDKQKNSANNQQNNLNFQGQNTFQSMQQQSAFQRRKNFFERKRFLNYQAHNPMDFQNITDPPNNFQNQQNHQRNKSGSGSPSQENKNSSNFQNLSNQRLNNKNNIGKQQLPQLDILAEQSKALNQESYAKKKQRNPIQAMHDRMPIDGNGPILSNERLKDSRFDNQKFNNNHVNQQFFQNGIYDQQKTRSQKQAQEQFENQDMKNFPYLKNNQHKYNNNSQGTLNENSINDDLDLNINDDQLLDENLTKGEGSNSEIINDTNNGDEQVSVYMKDNVIMRRIQIEGDNREFLMDPQGQIFDMNGLFIGTANTNELEELQEDSQQNLNNQFINNENAQDEYYQQNNLLNQQQEEMMLLEDDDDKY